MPRCHTPPSRTRRVTAPLPAACAMSPHHSLLHAPCRCTPPCCTHVPHRHTPPSSTRPVPAPLPATHATSPRPSLLHAPHHCAPLCCVAAHIAAARPHHHPPSQPHTTRC